MLCSQSHFVNQPERSSDLFFSSLPLLEYKKQEFGFLQLQILRRYKTDSQGWSQLQLFCICQNPEGYLPKTVDVLHMLFLSASFPFCLVVLGMIKVFY